MERFKINDRIKIVGKNVKGKVVFVGETHFADGILYGIAMDDPIGRHDGIMNGVRYFKCKENHGIFVKASQLQNVGNEKTGKKKSPSDNQETPSAKPNCKSGAARKSSSFENRYKMRNYTQSCPQRKFKLKPKEKSSAEDSPKNLKDSQMKSPPAENGYKPSDYTEAGPQKKFKPKERVPAQDQSPNRAEERDDQSEFSKLKEENDILNNDISYKDGQLATIQSELSRLKSCIHWCRNFSNSNNFKDINLKRFFTQEIDVRIKNMEDAIKNPDSKATKGHFKDYKTLKEHNKFLQLYVVDLEKQTEVLMETILRIRGIVLKQRKKQRRTNHKGSHKNYLQKHVGKFLKDNGFSSQNFTEDEEAVGSSRVSPSSFDRDLDSLTETIPKACKKDESKTFQPDSPTRKQQGRNSRERDFSPEDKDDDKKSVASVPESEEYKTTNSFPVWRENSKTKTHKKAKKRYEPYPRNLMYHREERPSYVSKNAFKRSPEELSSKLASENIKPIRRKSVTSPHLFTKGSRQYELWKLFCATKHARRTPTKSKTSNVYIPAKGKRSVIRPNPSKRKCGYSTQATLRK